MKKLMALLLAVGMTASIAGAQEVLSRNAVGYVKVEVEGGVGAERYYLLTMPFQSIDGGPIMLTEVFDAVPNNTVLSLWDDDTQSYVNYSRSARGAWLDGADAVELEQGQGVFVSIPAGEDPVDVVLMGEVPDADIVLQRATGYSLIGLPFPVETLLVETTMADELPNNSVISAWDADTQSYVNYSKSSRGAWLDDALTAVMRPGDGFFVFSGEPGQLWSEVKPYTWP